MKLKDFIRNTEYKRIRIATKNGSKFVFIGNTNVISLDDLDRESLKRIREDLQNAIRTYIPKKMSKANKKTDRDTKYNAILGRMKQLNEYTPFGEREVIESYPGDVEKDMLVIIVAGKEGWIDYDPPMPELKAENIDTTAAIKLIGGVYRQTIEVLTDMYETLEMGTKSGLSMTELKAIRAKVLTEEKTIRQNRYGCFSDPEYIIQQCKADAKKNADIRKQAYGANS